MTAADHLNVRLDKLASFLLRGSRPMIVGLWLLIVLWGWSLLVVGDRIPPA